MHDPRDYHMEMLDEVKKCPLKLSHGLHPRRTSRFSLKSDNKTLYL